MSDDENDGLAVRLAKIIKERGLTARGLALKAGLKSTAVRDILNGRSKSPRLETVTALSTTLGLDVNEIVSSDEFLDISNEFRTSTRYLARRDSAEELYGDKAPLAGHVIVRKSQKLIKGSAPVSFAGANLAGASFVGGSLIGANLTNTNLAFANFTRCDLRRVNFQDSIFYRTVFIEADLRGANFAGVDLSQAIFVEDPDAGVVP